MVRYCSPALVLATLCTLSAADPLPSVDRTLAQQAALAQARDFLTENKPAAAVQLLEQNLATADGNRVFLDLLRSAYAAELKTTMQANGDPKRIHDLRTKLTLLGGSPPAEAPAPVPVPAPPMPAAEPTKSAGFDILSQASVLFSQGKAEPQKFDLAAQLYAAAFANKVEMNPDQLTAWAYCRVRVAGDHLNRSGMTGAAAAELVTEIEDALKLAPNNAGLQKVGQELLLAAKQKAGGAVAPVASANPFTGGRTPTAPAAATSDWEVIETASFRVRHRGNRAVAEAVARAAEEKRTEIFTRWSGPPGGAWEPKCDIHLHPTAETFTASTRQPAAATGHAVVSLDGGRPVSRRVDLRAEDTTVAHDALPRELTHIIVTDLFPTQSPPRWAIEGMAVLAASPGEVDRYLRTAVKCHRGGELIQLATMLTLAEPPAERVTGFYVGSVSLVEFLTRWKGEKAFTTFLRDSQRYGMGSAMKRQYGVGDAQQLEDVWIRGALSSARGQAE